MERSRTWRNIGLAVAATAAAGAATGALLAYAGYNAWQRRRQRDLRGQIALITGGSRGLGLALARELAGQGCRLALCARDEQELASAAEQLASAEVLTIPCDIGDQQSVQRMVGRVLSRYGRIDILINNAGIIAVGPLESQTMQDYEEALRVMFWGVVYPTLAVLPQMLQRGEGRIANVTSIGGKVSVPHLLPYNCAKFAAVGFSEGLHAEVARHGVRVTTVVPGLMRTGSHLNAYFKGDHQGEFTWFSLGATLPFVSMDAARAARKIVAAIRRGQAEIILTPQARAMVAMNGLFPGAVSEALAGVNRLLPNPAGRRGRQRRLGRESESLITRSPLTALGRRAARDLNQEAGARSAALHRNPA